MPTRDIPEYQRRPQRDARPWTIAIHDRSHVVAADIKARDRRAVLAQHARLRIHLHADRGAHIGRIDAQREERRADDRRNAGIGFMRGVAEMALIDGAAAAE